MSDILLSKLARGFILSKQPKEFSVPMGLPRLEPPSSKISFCAIDRNVTDIVEKEMYTFEDRSGDSLTLRPELTAGVVRAAIEHGLLHNQTQRLWYQGQAFRHERPQKVTDNFTKSASNVSVSQTL